MTTTLFETEYDLQQINDVVIHLWDHIKDYAIIAFNGEMGAGKTTIIHHLCEYLGVQDSVNSPTFTLINEYHFLNSFSIDKNIFHIDLYRLQSTEEAIHAGIEDCILQKNSYTFIEWADKARSLLPLPYINIDISFLDYNTRKISVIIQE